MKDVIQYLISDYCLKLKHIVLNIKTIICISEIILNAINFHNRFSVPVDLNNSCLEYSKMLRDADKLDIWRIVADYYTKKTNESNSGIELDLPDTPGVSESVCRDLHKQSIVRISSLRNLNDFKLLQLGWVYDLNFSWSHRILLEKGYLESIYSTLPMIPEVNEIYENIMLYLNDKIKIDFNPA